MFSARAASFTETKIGSMLPSAPVASLTLLPRSAQRVDVCWCVLTLLHESRTVKRTTRVFFNFLPSLSTQAVEISGDNPLGGGEMWGT